MQRGIRVFDYLNNVEPPISKPIGKGRSKLLVDSRNRCLFYRYWYHSKRHKRRYDEVLKLLSKEFYISERTIIEIISKNQILMKRVYEENPIISKLKIKFDYLTWK